MTELRYAIKTKRIGSAQGWCWVSKDEYADLYEDNRELYYTREEAVFIAAMAEDRGYETLIVRVEL